MNLKLPAALVLAALAIAVAIALFVLPSTPAPGTPQQTTPASAPAPPPKVTFTDDVAPLPGSGQGAPDPFPADANESAWVERLDALLTSDEDNSITARKLIAALPGLPGEAQEEYVAHAVNLCEDEDFARLEAVYLTPSTPPEVIETIFNDALNRPDEIKLPLLVKTLANPAHPMAGESREILEMYLDLEPGTPPPAGWEEGVRQYLREQAE